MKSILNNETVEPEVIKWYLLLRSIEGGGRRQREGKKPSSYRI